MKTRIGHETQDLGDLSEKEVLFNDIAPEPQSKIEVRDSSYSNRNLILLLESSLRKAQNADGPQAHNFPRELE